MRDLWRLIVLGLMSFVVVGGAMSYSRDNDFRQALVGFSDQVRSFAGGAIASISQAAEVGIDPVQTASIGPELITVRVPRPQGEAWVGLTGFPDETAVSFAVPPLESYADGRLDLELNTQLASGGDGVLQIAVNGTPRQAIVLQEGQQDVTVSLPLTDMDLQRSSVTLDLAARGTTGGGQICPTDATNSGSVITLEPQSAMVLSTTENVDNPRTAIVAAPGPLALRLGQDAEQPLTIWAAQRLQRAGVVTEIVGDDYQATRLSVASAGGPALGWRGAGDVMVSGSSGVDAVAALRRGDAGVAAAPTIWPLSVTDLGGDTAVRNFRGMRRWTIAYDLADLPLGHTPDRLAINMRAGRLAGGSDWQVRVSLNGNLLETQRFAGTQSDLSLSVALPLEMQGLANAVTIDLVDTSPNEGVCNRGPDAQAQLLPSTQLQTLGPQPQEGWNALIADLAKGSIAISTAGELTPAQATKLAGMLAQFLPANAPIADAAQGNASLILTNGANYRSALQLAGSLGGIEADALVFSRGGPNGEPLLVTLADSAVDWQPLDIADSDVLILVRRHPIE